MAKQILIFSGKYAICDDGRIISMARSVQVCGMRPRMLNEKALRPVCVDGYRYVTLTSERKNPTRHAVHILVCTAFHGPRPGRDEVNHIDGNKGNNIAANLEWTTRSGNQIHAANNGLKPVGVKSHLAKLTESQVQEIRGLKGKEYQSSIAKRFGVSQTCVSKIHCGTKWKQLKVA